jgi:hypothetical protein
MMKYTRVMGDSVDSGILEDAFENYFFVHENYKSQLKECSKHNFDPFCRLARIKFYYKPTAYFLTTVGQLNFFKWALKNHVIDYIRDNLADIESDMNVSIIHPTTTISTLASSATASATSSSSISLKNDDQPADASKNTKKRSISVAEGFAADFNIDSATDLESKLVKAKEKHKKTLVNLEGTGGSTGDPTGEAVVPKQIHRKTSNRYKRKEPSVSRSLTKYSIPTTIHFD